MQQNEKRKMLTGIILLSAFVVWTVMIRIIDVQKVGPKETEVGFATLNVWFHQATGVHKLLYTISDWLGLVPIIICMILLFHFIDDHLDYIHNLVIMDN